MFKGLILCTAAFAVGCSTLSTDVSLNKITPEQRFYLGRIHVNMKTADTLLKKGEVVAPTRCEIYLNYDVSPSVKLAADGWFFYKSDRQELRIRKMACYHQANKYSAAWHLQTLSLEPFARPSAQLEATYFGDVTVHWQIDANATLAAAEKDYSSPPPARVGRVENSGQLNATVAGDKAASEEWLFARYPDLKTREFKVTENLVVRKTVENKQ